MSHEGAITFIAHILSMLWVRLCIFGQEEGLNGSCALVVKALDVGHVRSRSWSVINIPPVMLLQLILIEISGLCIGQYKNGIGVSLMILMSNSIGVYMFLCSTLDNVVVLSNVVK